MPDELHRLLHWSEYTRNGFFVQPAEWCLDQLRLRAVPFDVDEDLNFVYDREHIWLTPGIVASIEAQIDEMALLVLAGG